LENKKTSDTEILLFLWLDAHDWKHLPRAGGIYDQPAWLWQKLIDISYYKREWDNVHKGSVKENISSDEMDWLKSTPNTEV
jgi:hypothetical protein